MEKTKAWDEITEKRDTNKTGGGPKPPSPSPDAIEIVEMVPQEFEICFNEFDCDGIKIARQNSFDFAEASFKDMHSFRMLENERLQKEHELRMTQMAEMHIRVMKNLNSEKIKRKTDILVNKTLSSFIGEELFMNISHRQFDSDVTNHIKAASIIHQTTTPCSPEQNGAAEKMNSSLIERAKCMLLNANLPKQSWADAVHTAASVINRSPTQSL
ncbi:unnamed protein product [Colias eurytheme]|nr:unnamed protein product [Colias eurytheme]